MTTTTTVEKLSEEIDVAQWEWLRAHNERGALIVVNRGRDLADVGERIAADDSPMVQRWLVSNLLSKPTPEQVVAWDSDPTRNFSTLVVSPFVLVQEIVKTDVFKD
jgi:hypothetical protein